MSDETPMIDVGERVKILHRHRSIDPISMKVKEEFPAGAQGVVVKITRRPSILHEFVAHSVLMDGSTTELTFINDVVEGIVRV